MCLFSSLSQAKVLIFTYSFNRPDFIEIHYKTFKKFLLDDYEFIVFNDAIDTNLCEQIEQICKKYEIQCIRIPQEIHSGEYNASVRNCDVVNYSLQKVGFNHDDIVALVDSDLFLVKEFSIKKYLNDHDLSGLHQIRDEINYLWIGLAFLDMSRMPNKNTINFNCGSVNGTATDSGGFTHYYLKNNPTATVQYIDGVHYLKDFFCNDCAENNVPKCLHHIDKMKTLGFSNPLIDLTSQSRHSIMEIYLNNTFLHYRAGSNWNYESPEYHERKTQLLTTFVNELLSNSIGKK